MEDYLKAIYYFQFEDGQERVTTSSLAEYMDVTPPTVSSMFDTLEARDLIDHQKYNGARLTEDGKLIALEVIRHHRLLEAYLTEHLDFDWADVHEEADRLEHHISEAFESRLAAALGDPEFDPHGAPIPDANLKLPEDREDHPLTSLSEGEEGIVQEVLDDDASVLRYLADHGVTPGSQFRITEIAPFGMVTLRLTGEVGTLVSLPESIAQCVRISPLASEAEA